MAQKQEIWGVSHEAEVKFFYVFGRFLAFFAIKSYGFDR